jgi:hypothetical protein
VGAVLLEEEYCIVLLEEEYCIVLLEEEYCIVLLEEEYCILFNKFYMILFQYHNLYFKYIMIDRLISDNIIA